MKKFLKSVMGLASVAAVAAGAYYFTKKWMEEKDEDLEDDFDDLDFEEDDDFREYVTLDMEEEDQEDADDFEEKMDDISDVAEENITPDYEEVTTMPAEDDADDAAEQGETDVR